MWQSTVTRAYSGGGISDIHMYLEKEKNRVGLQHMLKKYFNFPSKNISLPRGDICQFVPNSTQSGNSLSA